MALEKFTLKEEHLKLLRHLNWKLDEKSISTNIEINQSPFGGIDLYEDIYTILEGKPKEFDPIQDEKIIDVSDELKEVYKTLFNELPKALNIVLYTQAFKPGLYVKKWYDVHWKYKN